MLPSQETLSRRSLAALEWPLLQKELAARTRGALGHDVAAAHAPFAAAAESARLRTRVAECARLDKHPLISSRLTGTQDPSAPFEAAAKDALLTPGGIHACGHFFETIGLLGADFGALRASSDSSTPAPSLCADWERAPRTPALCAKITQSVSSDGLILDTASPELARLRARRSARRQAFESLLDARVKKWSEDGLLQDRFYDVVDGRYVVPVKVSEQSKLPGVLMGNSNTGQSVFIEPMELTSANNELKETELAIEAEEARILRALSRGIAALVPDYQGWVACVAELDLCFAGARLAADFGLTEPAARPEGRLNFRNLFHPALKLREEFAAGKREIVLNSFGLDASSVAAGSALILSGPNTGGKTVLLKAAGLAALMARAGLFVPAESGSELPHYAGVFAFIGDEQDIAEGLSSFSAQILDLRSVTETKQAPLLILVDEILSSTDPEEASALAQALLEEFIARGHHVIVTTHFAELSLRTRANPRIRLCGMEFRGGVPTYRLRPDELGSSHALEVAETLGLPNRVLSRARDLISKAKRDYDFAKNALRQKETELAEEYSRALKKFEADKSSLKDRYESRVEELEKRLSGFLASARAELEKKIEELSRRTRIAPAKARADAAETLAGVARKSREQFAETELGAKAPEAARPLEAGNEVRVRSMGGATGKILEIRQGGVTATVQVGNFRVEKALADLRCFERPKRPTGKTFAGLFSGSLDAPAVAPKIDLRGKRYDEAMSEVGRYLDQAFRGGRHSVTVVTGHGTGAIKTGVKELLASLPYVREFRPEREGDDGALVVEFDF
ncbi:MAG: Smr/MutS family protein [Deltaproteobacteria bacterium]|nr:Smr/MutS family protein [Deltaproteobacteria bacterium]